MSHDRLWRLIWDEGLEAIALVSRDGKFIDVNPSWCDVVGYTRQELVGRTFQQITHPDDTEDDVEMARQVEAGEIPRYTMWKRYLHKRGHTVWVKLKVCAYTNEDGEFEFFLSQVVPNHLIEQQVISATKAPGGVVPARANSFDALAFARANWKWILAGLILISPFVATMWEGWLEILRSVGKE